jgi:hypothetical protein
VVLVGEGLDLVEMGLCLGLEFMDGVVFVRDGSVELGDLLAECDFEVLLFVIFLGDGLFELFDL